MTTTAQDGVQWLAIYPKCELCGNEYPDGLCDHPVCPTCWERLKRDAELGRKVRALNNADYDDWREKALDILGLIDAYESGAD